LVQSPVRLSIRQSPLGQLCSDFATKKYRPPHAIGVKGGCSPQNIRENLEATKLASGQAQQISFSFQRLFPPKNNPENLGATKLASGQSQKIRLVSALSLTPNLTTVKIHRRVQQLLRK